MKPPAAAARAAPLPDVRREAAQRDFAALLARIRACRACEAQLPLGPRPVVQASTTARLLIVGQAPGAKVHASGVPWDDASGMRLRNWLGIDNEAFYEASRIAIVPMGYCYPGRGGSGDLPPRRECAELWLGRLLAGMPRIELTLLIGQYAQRHFLGPSAKASLTDTVAAFADYLPRYLPLPHPSPRNSGWFKHHPWFEREVVPLLRERVRDLLAAGGGPIHVPGESP